MERREQGREWREERDGSKGSKGSKEGDTCMSHEEEEDTYLLQEGADVRREQGERAPNLRASNQLH